MVHLGFGEGSETRRLHGIAALALAIAAAGGLATKTAEAAILTQTVPLSVGPITFSDTGVDAFVNPFDPNLGTLTGVTVHLTGTLTPGVEAFDVPSPLPAVFTAPVTFNPRISIAVPDEVTEILPAETLSFTQGDTPRQQLAVGTPDAVDLSETVAPSALEIFPGRGVDIYITGHSFPTFGVPSPAFFGMYEGEDLAALSGQVEVAYSYVPSGGGASVPEPASPGLLSTGLVTLGLAVRLRRRPHL